MAWTYLLIASCFEIGFALGLKYTDGFTRLVPSVLTVTAGVASFLLLSQSLRMVPVGTAILGILLLHEPRDVPRLVCLGLIISGIVGLRLTSTVGS